LTREHLKKFKEIQKNSKKPQSDTWNATGLTRVHLKKLKKLKNKNKNKKIQKNHEVTCGSHCSWPLMI